MTEPGGHARYALLGVGLLGEFLFGGCIFGWNALHYVLDGLHFYEDECGLSRTHVEPGSDSPDLGPPCRSQDSQMAVVFNVGILAVNFGPAMAGPALDFLGPRVTAAAGCLVASSGFIMMAFANRAPDSLLPAGAFFAALGGVAFHVAQMHVSAQFPANRGLVSSLYVGCFIASGLMYEFVRAAFIGTGRTHATYRGAMIALACVISVFVGLMLWLMPQRAFCLGDHYHFVPRQMRFKTETKEQWAATQLLRRSASGNSSGLKPAKGEVMMITRHQSDNTESLPPPQQAPQSRKHSAQSALTSDRHVSFGQQSGDERTSHSRTSGKRIEAADRGDSAMRSMALHSRPVTDSTANSLATDVVVGQGPRCSSSDVAASLHKNDAGAPESGNRVHPAWLCLHWGGNCVRNGRPMHDRWRRLSDVPASQQIRTKEFICISLIFCFNVLAQQYYLGNTKSKLEKLGDDRGAYVRIFGYIVSGSAVVAPGYGFMLDKLGYGLVLLVLNTLTLTFVLLSMIPVLGVQVATFIVWAAARFLLYASYFTIIGSLFSYKHFGRVIALISTVTSLVGLTQLGLTHVALHTLERNFLPIDIAAAVWVTLLYIPACAMYRLERTD